MTYRIWETEKAVLIKRLRDNPEQIARIVDDWFRSTVFQVHVQHAMPEYELRRLQSKDDLSGYEHHERKQLAVNLGIELATAGLVEETVEDGPLDGMGGRSRIRRLSALVLGRPQMVKDNATGKLSYVRPLKATVFICSRRGFGKSTEQQKKYKCVPCGEKFLGREAFLAHRCSKAPAEQKEEHQDNEQRPAGAVAPPLAVRPRGEDRQEHDDEDCHGEEAHE